MTRFVGESLQTRTGRNSKALLGKDRQKSMKVFQETGKHPLIEATREENARDVLTPLPTLDINRPHIFMDFQHQGKPQGRLIVELFEDLYPTVCAAFRHRCLEGHHTLKDTRIHKVQPKFAIFGGISASGGAIPISAAANSQRKLQHVDPGLLSVSLDGSHFAITLARALALDSSYKVIGRIGKGSEILEKFDDVLTDIEDAPEQSLVIAQCGTTDHRGLNETLSQAAAGESTSDVAATARGNMAEASAGMMDALAQGLKRKPGLVAQGSKSLHGKRRKGMGALSDDDSDSDSDSSTGPG